MMTTLHQSYKLHSSLLFNSHFGYTTSLYILFFFFNDPATPEFYTLSLHDALPIFTVQSAVSAILMVTLYLPGDTSGLNRLLDGLIGGVTGLVVVGVFPRSACPGSVVVAGTGTRGASS